MSIRFEWDPAKNDANQRKHGLRFEDAKQERERYRQYKAGFFY